MKPTTSKKIYIKQAAGKRKYTETKYQQDKIYMKPTTSKIKYTWNQLLARENIHETNY